MLESGFNGWFLRAATLQRRGPSPPLDRHYRGPPFCCLIRRSGRGWRGLRRGERIVDGDGQEGMLMKAGGQVRGSLGRRGGGQDAARAWRGQDIEECRFKGTAGGQLSTDRRGEGCAA